MTARGACLHIKPIEVAGRSDKLCEEQCVMTVAKSGIYDAVARPHNALPVALRDSCKFATG